MRKLYTDGMWIVIVPAAALLVLATRTSAGVVLTYNYYPSILLYWLKILFGAFQNHTKQYQFIQIIQHCGVDFCLWCEPDFYLQCTSYILLIVIRNLCTQLFWKKFSPHLVVNWNSWPLTCFYIKQFILTFFICFCFLISHWVFT